MKFKLDENLGRHSEKVLAAAGHDVSTVRQQNLQGVADEELIERCRTEGRCLGYARSRIRQSATVLAEPSCRNRRTAFATKAFIRRFGVARADFDRWAQKRITHGQTLDS